MVGKVRPRKIIMPSELTGLHRAPRRSGPVITYSIDQLDPEQLRRLFPSFQIVEVEFMEASLTARTLEGGDPAREVGGIASELSSLNPRAQQTIMLDLIRQGKNDEEIGTAFGLSRWQVRNLRYRLGIKKDRGGNVYVESPVSRDPREVTGVSVPTSEAPLAGTHTPTADPGEGRGTAGLALTIQGIHTAQDLLRRVEALRGLLAASPEDRTYSFHVDLAELAD